MSVSLNVMKSIIIYILRFTQNDKYIGWRGDSNPQAVRHTHLKRTCIPVPSPQHFFEIITESLKSIILFDIKNWRIIIKIKNILYKKKKSPVKGTLSYILNI